MAHAENKMATFIEKCLKQRAVIEILTMEGCAPIDINRITTAVYGHACASTVKS